MISRRAIAERIIARASTRGTPIDGDAEFMAIVELWVAGDIEAGEMRDRYNALVTQRPRRRRRLGLSPELSAEMPQAPVLETSTGPDDEATASQQINHGIGDKHDTNTTTPDQST